ncbi:MAG: sigma-70 family RNA polymerase sigma factor [Anaerolineae bacterium]|nr:sigma-70 family RNA polymerase sigma factor [Anaerolineae bacterium]
MEEELNLLKRAQAYDKEAIGELYDLYSELIYAYIYRRTSHSQVAEDLTSEVFIRVLQAIHSEKFWKTSFRAWLYRIAHNLVIDYYRQHNGKESVHIDDLPLETTNDDNPEKVQVVNSNLANLSQAIEQLTELQKQVIVLRFGEGLSSAEVAEIMEKSVGAIEGLQHRALAALKRILK